MTIESQTPLDYHVDGELLSARRGPRGTSRINITVEPRTLSFIVPGRFYRLFHPFDAEEITSPANE